MLQVQQLRASSHISSLFKLPTAEEVLANLRLGDNGPVGTSNTATSNIEDLEAGLNPNKSTGPRGAAGALGKICSTIPGRAGPAVQRLQNLAAAATSSTGVMKLSGSSGQLAGLSSSVLSGISSKGVVSLRVWLVVGYVFLLHLGLMMSFTGRSPDPTQAAVLCAGMHGMTDAGNVAGNGTAAAAAAAAVAVAAKVGGGMAMTAKERASAFAQGL